MIEVIPWVNQLKYFDVRFKAHRDLIVDVSSILKRKFCAAFSLIHVLNVIILISMSKLSSSSPFAYHCLHNAHVP